MNRIFRIIVFALCFISLSAHAKPVKMPEFSLPTNSGIINHDFFKGKVLYVDFWASWCKPCVKSFPWLNKLQQKHKDAGLVVLAINMDKKKDKADKFLEEILGNFFIAYDPAGKTAQAFKVKGMPSSYLVDRQGNIRGSHMGFREKDAEKLEQAVVQLLKQ